MDTLVRAQTFVAVSEVWVPKGERLVHGGGDYGALEGFEAASRRESFGLGEGLPGKAWAERRPVVLKSFDGSYFKRTEAARDAGLTAAVAIPVFAGEALRAVLVVLCAGDDDHIGAIEVWADDDGTLSLEDGYYGAAGHFEWVSRRTSFPRGQGLPGAVLASGAPILMRDLGSGYRFVRAEAAGKAGLTTGLGIPVLAPGGPARVVTLLSARGTPIARRFEIWRVRGDGAELTDGICEIEGPLWPQENPDPAPRRARAHAGPVGRALGTGMPVAQGGAAGLPGGYARAVALPIHSGDGAPSHVVAWHL